MNKQPHEIPPRTTLRFPEVIGRLVHKGITIDQTPVPGIATLNWHSTEDDMEILVESPSGRDWARADTLGTLQPLILFDEDAEALAENLGKESEAEIYTMMVPSSLDEAARSAVHTMSQTVHVLKDILGGEVSPSGEEAKEEDREFVQEQLDSVQYALRLLHLARFFNGETHPGVSDLRHDPPRTIQHPPE